MMKICICVVTYCRPEGLKRLLDGLNKLEFIKTEAPSLKVVVIDNEASGAACAYCEERSLSFKWELECYVEALQGISYARNKALACCGDDWDFIAFIDDDEIPEPYWLEELLDVQNSYEADVVTGPVLPVFSDSVSSWITKGNFFQRKRYKTGHTLNLAATGNVLISSKVFKGNSMHFDERFALTGGEDTHFFMRVSKRGHKIVWADNAIVAEWVPGNRANAKWILLRSYQGGNIYARCRLHLDGSLVVILERFSIGIFRILQGLSLVLPSFLAGKVSAVKAFQRIFLGVGTISGLFGMTYRKYQRRDRGEDSPD